jgi:phosphomevalonate kinase
MEPDASSKTIYDAVMNESKWGQTVKQFSLPSNMDIIMGDVCGGSSSTSMARAVLQWRKDEPEIANEVWNTLAKTNLELYQSFESLNELYAENQEKFQDSLLKLSEQTYDEWLLLINDDKVAKAFVHIRQLFNKARSYLKRMGEGAGIEIEPDVQTKLADASQAIPGVLCAGVPGAGGIDAIYAIILSKEARNRVESMWSLWGLDDTNSQNTMVCPLILNAEGVTNGGVRIENDDGCFSL